MAFLRKITNHEGKTYLAMVEGYRESGTVGFQKIQYIGRSDILEELHDDVDAYAQSVLEEYNSKTTQAITLSKTLTTDNFRKDSFSNIGHLLIENIYKTLSITKVLDSYSKDHRFKYNLDEIMKLLVFGRILDPKSKSKTICDFQKTLFGSWNVSQNDMDRSLDHFSKLKTQIQLQMHKSISNDIGRRATLVFYDVTNYYFETDLSDRYIDENGEVVLTGLRQCGCSKEKRRDPIVQALPIKTTLHFVLMGNPELFPPTHLFMDTNIYLLLMNYFVAIVLMLLLIYQQ